MLKKIFIIITMAAIFMLGACEVDDDNPLVGKWLDNTSSGFEFHDDMKFDAILFGDIFMFGTYDYTDTEITMSYQIGTDIVEYSINGDTLTITDDDVSTDYEKQ